MKSTNAMKMKMSMSMMLALAAVASAYIHPDVWGAFRSDTTLRFMRGTRASPLSDAQQGPNADSKKAQEAADKVAEQQQQEEQATTTAASPIEQAGKAVSGAVADALESAQEGPQADSKKAQKAADKVADEQKKQGTEAPKQANPLEQVADAVIDAVTPMDAKKKKVDAKEDKEATKGLVGQSCKNSFRNWKDAKGNDCEDYAEGEWCNQHGGYGDGWMDEWGKFEDVAKKGKSALQVCCVCGGGDRQEEDPAAAAGPAAAPSAAPSGAPVPAITGPILGTKAGRPLQSQGYSGDLVVHIDQETMTDDWGAEFGPTAGQRDIETICKDHPGNAWCLFHGYHEKAAAARLKTIVSILVALFLACL